MALDGRFLQRLARDRDVAVSLWYPGLSNSSDPALIPVLTQLSAPPFGATFVGLDDPIVGQLEVDVIKGDGDVPLAPLAYLLVTLTLDPLGMSRSLLKLVRADGSSAPPSYQATWRPSFAALVGTS